MGCACSNNTAQGSAPEDDFSVTPALKSNAARTLNLSGQGLIALPAAHGMEEYQILNLSNNFLTKLPADLEAYKHLTELNLESNRLMRIPDSLIALENLTSLNVANNPLSRISGCDVIPHMKNLQKFSLASCSLRVVPKAVTQSTTITMLDLSYNHFIDAGPVGHIPTLTRLSLAFCSLRGPLPAGLVASTNLLFIDLSGNTCNFGATSLTPLAANLNTLVLCATCLTRFPPALAVLVNIKRLSLAQNAIESLEGIGALKELEHLDLSDCSLWSLPPGIEEASTITFLELNGNDIRTVEGLGAALPFLKTLNVINVKASTVPKPNQGLAPCDADTLWYEISQVASLQQVDWQIWGDRTRNISNPYSTRIPLPLCQLRLTAINNLPVRGDMFTGDPLSTLLNMLKDGYYKVDFGFETEAITSHYSLLGLFRKQYSGVSKHIEKVIVRYILFLAMHMYMEEHPPSFSSVADNQNNNNSMRAGSLPRSVSEGSQNLLSRTNDSSVQSLSNIPSSVEGIVILVPPVDVAILHYAHMTVQPAAYRQMCEQMFGRVVPNYYRRLLALKDCAKLREYSTSVETWSNMVGSVFGDAAPWLQYEADFKDGDKVEGGHEAGRSNHGAAQQQGGGNEGDALSDGSTRSKRNSKKNKSYAKSPRSSSKSPSSTRSALPESAETDPLSILDPNNFVFLKPQITQTTVNVTQLSESVRLLRKFNRQALKYRSHYEPQVAEGWNRYQKYLCALLHMGETPIPTLGIHLMLHLHRSSPIKYQRDLQMIGIRGEIFWYPTIETQHDTEQVWSDLFNEPYLPGSAGADGTKTTMIAEDMASGSGSDFGFGSASDLGGEGVLLEFKPGGDEGDSGESGSKKAKSVGFVARHDEKLESSGATLNPLERRGSGSSGGAMKRRDNASDKSSVGHPKRVRIGSVDFGMLKNSKA